MERPKFHHCGTYTTRSHFAVCTSSITLYSTAAVWYRFKSKYILWNGLKMASECDWNVLSWHLRKIKQLISLTCTKTIIIPDFQSPKFWETGYNGSRVPGSQGPRVPGYQGPRVPGSHDPRVPGYQGPRVPGSQDTRVPGFQGPRVPGSKTLRRRLPYEIAHSFPGCQGNVLKGSQDPKTPGPKAPRLPG